MKKIVGVLVKPFRSAERHTLKLESYKDFYPLLECESFDVATRKFGKNYYDIYCDDEGLLLDKPPAIYTLDNKGAIVEMLVGNCFICKHDDEGETISLTEDEIIEILDSNVEGIPYCEL